MKRVLFLQKMYGTAEEARRLLQQAGCPYEPCWSDEVSPQPENVAILVTKEHHLDKTTIARFPNLEMISLGFTGHDDVDKVFAEENGIHVYYVPGYATDSVAELILGLTISILRRIPKSNRVIREGAWDKPVIPGTELNGKTVGILGTGTIGCRTAELFLAFNCSLLGYSRNENPRFLQLGGRYVEKDELFGTSDIIAVCQALSDGTQGSIKRSELEHMKQGAVFINTARSGLVDHDDLVSVLRDGHIHAGIDVYSDEPERGKDPLLELENVVATPHVGFKTHEALTRLTQQTIANIGRFFAGDSKNRLVPPP